MDMEMEIPDPEELQWLEANASNFHDDFEEFDYYPEDEEQHQQEQSPPNQASKSPHPKEINKRARPESPDSTPDVVFIEENVKRSRVDGSGEENEDEDWLRYSPPRHKADEVVEEEVAEEKILSRFATEIEGECLPVTGLEGERVYAKISPVGEDEMEGRVKRKLDLKCDSKGLIADPIRVLMQRVEQDEFAKALQASAEEQNDIVTSEASVVNEQLWVDKYAPSSFTELLSNEQTNREVLMWLKQWDSCVFGSDIKSTTDDVLSALRRHSSGVQHSKLFNRGSSGSNKGHRFSKRTLRDHNDLDQEDLGLNGIQDQWAKKHKQSGPPEQKILLLCGPPGLGKTTLAHVAARHCGYRVVEINASDDRASSTIEAKILDVVQMNSVTVDSKPKCLIIDEIDGALNEGKGAVEVILKMVSADKKFDTGKENVARDEHHERKSSRKKQGHTSLLRPVICICNDLYAPALRPLRQVAKVHVFVQPTVSRVVNRLKYICNREEVKTNSTALTALAQYTECDIRSCLNTIQFLNKKKEILNVLDIGSQVVGRKDASKNAFDIWKEIFHKRRTKRGRTSNCPGGVSNDLEFLHTLVSNRGDYDLILDGVHENILQLRYYDPLMQKTVQCLDGLGSSDIIHQYVLRTQHMSLQAYQPPVAIRIHSLVAQVEKPKIEWPKSFNRYRTSLTEKKDVLHSWHNNISPNISRHLSARSFVQDSISPLLHILSPPTLRPVAMHLLSEREKIVMAQLVDTMVSYAITYKNMKSDLSHGNLRHEDKADNSLLSFDPPICEFVNFKGYNSCHFALASALKQVLVHEVEKQKILQNSNNRSTHPTDSCSKENQALAGHDNGTAQSLRSFNAASSAEKNMNLKNTSNQKQLATSTSSTPSTKQLAPSTSSTLSTTGFSGGDSTSVGVTSLEKTKKPSGGPSSFFDRFKKVSIKGSHDMGAVNRPKMAERDSRPLIFKFNEGYTNAVRRPVRMREFFL